MYNFCLVSFKCARDSYLDDGITRFYLITWQGELWAVKKRFKVDRDSRQVAKFIFFVFLLCNTTSKWEKKMWNKHREINLYWFYYEEIGAERFEGYFSRIFNLFCVNEKYYISASCWRYPKNLFLMSHM